MEENMGEYIYIKGKQYKTGCCEDLYYISFQKWNEVRNILDNGKQDRPVNKSRFRFPFPDESYYPVYSGSDFQRELILRAPTDMMRTQDHDEICVHVGGSDGCNVFIPCVLGKNPLRKPITVNPWMRG
jgi:hypothetical protein